MEAEEGVDEVFAKVEQIFDPLMKPGMYRMHLICDSRTKDVQDHEH